MDVGDFDVGDFDVGVIDAGDIDVGDFTSTTNSKNCHQYQDVINLTNRS